MTKEQEIERGKQAAAVLENPVFAQAVLDLAGEYTRAWMESASSDAQGRERLYVAMQVSRDFVAHLQSMVSSGKISAQQIARLKTPK